MSITQIKLNNKVKNPRNLIFEQDLKDVSKAVKAQDVFNAKVRAYNLTLQGLYSSLKPQAEIKNKIQEDELIHKNLDKDRYVKSDREKEAEAKVEAEAIKKNEKINAAQLQKLEELAARLHDGFDDVARTLVMLLNNGVVHHDAVIKALEELDKNRKINNNTQTVIIDEIKKNGDVTTEQLKAVKEVLNYNKATLKEIENLTKLTEKNTGILTAQKVGKTDMFGRSLDVSYDAVHDEFIVEYSNTKYPFS